MATLEEAHRRKCRAELATWCSHALAPLGQRPARHHRLAIGKLAAVARGDVDRLMILMPPGSAKSTYASVLFPPWFLAQAPRLTVIGASHTSSLAEDFSQRVMDQVREHPLHLGFGLRREAAELWTTTSGGRYRAAGVGGPITGSRADLLVIDDPVKSHEAAASRTQRDRVYNWYRMDALTRLKPGGRVVLIMTRWHADDLGGRLLEDMQTGGDQWDVLRLPALAEADDPLGRAPGDALWPDYEDVAALERKRSALGDMAFASLFQQTPRVAEGALFKVERIGTLEAAPVGGKRVRAWDLAATEDMAGRDPDWTAGVLLNRGADDRYAIEDVVRVRGGPEDVVRTILATAQRDGRGVTIGLPQDPGQAGKVQVVDLTRKLAGFVVQASPETGNKATRAGPAAAQANVGNVALVRAAWNRAFLDELRDFPSGAKDDQVDAFSRGFGMLTALPAPARRMTIGHMGR